MVGLPRSDDGGRGIFAMELVLVGLATLAIRNCLTTEEEVVGAGCSFSPTDEGKVPLRGLIVPPPPLPPSENFLVKLFLSELLLLWSTSS